MNRRRLTLAGAAFIASMVILAACDDGGEERGVPGASGASFAGPVTGTEALVGLVDNSGDRRVLAYVCDGKTVGIWFTGEAAPDGTVDLISADGARLRGRIAGGTLAGTVALARDGPEHAFEAPAVTAPAGVYRARGEVADQPAVGGWVVLPDGRQRGGVRTSTGFIDQESDLARPDKPVTSFISEETDL